MPSEPRTLMWEAKAAPGRTDALLAFAVEHAHNDAAVYTSSDGRVVVIDPTDTGLPPPSGELLARPVHEWRFDPVPRA